VDARRAAFDIAMVVGRSENPKLSCRYSTLENGGFGGIWERLLAQPGEE
jgi:hypothetical protein